MARKSRSTRPSPVVREDVEAAAVDTVEDVAAAAVMETVTEDTEEVLINLACHKCVYPTITFVKESFILAIYLKRGNI